MAAVLGSRLRALSTAVRAARTRAFNTGRPMRADGEIHPGYFKKKELEIQYQVDNGLRVRKEKKKLSNYNAMGSISVKKPKLF